MEFEIESSNDRVITKRKDELANNKITNSSIEQNKEQIILQMNKNHLYF